MHCENNGKQTAVGGSSFCCETSEFRTVSGFQNAELKTKKSMTGELQKMVNTHTCNVFPCQIWYSNKTDGSKPSVRWRKRDSFFLCSAGKLPFSTDTKETAIVLNETPNVAVKRDLISRVPMCQKVRLMWWQPLSFRFVQAWNKIDIYPNLRKLIPFVPGSSRDIKIYPQSSLTDDVVSGNISSSDSTRLCDRAGVIGITAPEGKAIYAFKNQSEKMQNRAILSHFNPIRRRVQMLCSIAQIIFRGCKTWLLPLIEFEGWQL